MRVYYTQYHSNYRETMMIDTNVMAGIQAHIQNGLPKEKSHYVTDDETSQFWDQLAAEMANPPQGTNVYDVVRE